MKSAGVGCNMQWKDKMVDQTCYFMKLANSEVIKMVNYRILSIVLSWENGGGMVDIFGFFCLFAHLFILQRND